MKLAFTIVALIASAEAISLETNAELRSMFNFGDLLDNGANTLTSIASGNNDVVQNLQTQVG